MRAAGGMGPYGYGDSNVNPGGVSPLGEPYNERVLFNGTPEVHSPAPKGATTVHQIGNINGPVAPYGFNLAAVSKQIIGANEQRSYLCVQNLSTYANLFINFGFDAGLNSGLMLLPTQSWTWDQFCPIAAVYAYFDSGAVVQPGFALEGTDQ